MKTSDTVVRLSWLVAALAVLAAGAGLFWQGGGAPYAFTTLRGQEAQIFGQGLYAYDTLLTGAGFKGQDAVALFLGVPLLVLTTVLYRRGSLRGSLLLTGALGYFLYVYASMALSAAYNRLFLVYVALFAASLWAFIRLFSSFDLQLLGAHLSGPVPRRGLVAFLFASGGVTLIIWGLPLVISLISGGPLGRLDTYTTAVTYALDLAIITPALFVAGALIRRGSALGYLTAMPLLTLIVLLLPMIVLSTVFQSTAGVPFTPGEIIGPICGFALLGVIGVWLLAALLRGIPARA